MAYRRLPSTSRWTSPESTPAKLTITNNSGSVALDGATLNTITNSTNIAVQLTEAQQSVAGLGTSLLLDMGQGAVRDLAGNLIAASDQTPPTATSATYAPSSQPGLPFYTYAIAFSEILGERIDFHSIRIGANLSQSISLQDIDLVTYDGDAITATTANSQLATADPPYLFITITGAVEDLFGNDIADTTVPFTPASSNAQDAIIPESSLVSSNAQATNSATPANGAPPTLALNGSSADTVPQATVCADAGAVCSDDRDPSRTVYADPFHSLSIGTHTLTYTCTDSDGNAAVPLIRTLTVTGRPPSLEIYHDATVTVRVGGAFKGLAAGDIWCYDITDGDLSSSVTAAGAVDTSNPGTCVVTYTCTGHGH